MHTFSSERVSLRAMALAFYLASWAGLAAILAVAAGQAMAAQMPPQAQQPALGDPVNLYAPNAIVYGPSRQDGEIHPRHVLGQVWLMAGEPGESNVAVQLGDQGVLVIDAGEQAMAPKLLAEIQRLAQEHGGEKKAIRKVIKHQWAWRPYWRQRHSSQSGQPDCRRRRGRPTKRLC